MRIAFRADASLEIGHGHVARCLTLAQALRRKGAECLFICRELPGNLLDLIRQSGFHAVGFPVSPAATVGSRADSPAPPSADPFETDWERDAESTVKALEGKPWDWLVVDHYGLDARWESALRPHCKRLLAIDDRADRPHDCDMLLDQNLVAEIDTRYDGLLPEACVTLFGPRYALLQPSYPEFHSAVRPRSGPVRRLLIYFGGADTHDLTGRTLRSFLGLGRSDVQADVVGHPGSPFFASLLETSEGHANVRVHGALESLAPLMAEADLAVGAGGATSWERLCLGLPALVVTLAENQTPIAKELDRRGLIRWIGRKEEATDDTIARSLGNALCEPLDPEWSLRCLQTVDGRGTECVVSVMSLNGDTPLKVRPATAEDETLILEWANDPFVRNRSFDTARIDPQTHKAWFRGKLEDRDGCRYCIVETEDVLPVGQVRFERSGAVWEIHYALSALARGRGIGTRLLETALATFEDADRERFMGRVKTDNIPSCRIFRNLGFSENEADGQLVFRRP
jgi:UDP-2,4-diacetamido-2,4,6-trideoxy-beta-L-altropyranose hydrolase